MPERRAAWLLVLAFTALFAVVALGRASAVFGDSDEGSNGAAWGQCSRAIRDRGVLDSALGGRRLDGTRYATHPPLMCWTTAGVESVVGEHRWSTRFPAIAASIAVVPLLYLLLLTVGARPLVAATAAVLTLTAPMFMVYGSMLDTPVFSLPFGVAVLLVWQRDARAGARHDLLAAVTAAAAALAGWQGASVGVLVAATVVLIDRRRVRAAAPFAIGSLAGIGVTVLWSAWVYGGLSGMHDKLLLRSGAEGGMSLGASVSFQLEWLAVLLVVALVGMVLCVVATSDVTWRPIAIVSLVTVVAYGLVFRQGAGGHQYWNYWALVPAAVGLAYGASHLDRRMTRDGITATARLAALAVTVVLVAAGHLLPHNRAAAAIERGRRPAALLMARLPRQQQTVWYVGPADRPYQWIVYDTRRLPHRIADTTELTAIARRHPDDVVLLLADCEGDALCERVSRSTRSPAVVPARALASV